MEIEYSLENSEEFVKSCFSEDTWEKHISDINKIKEEIIKEGGDLNRYVLNWDSHMDRDNYCIFEYPLLDKQEIAVEKINPTQKNIDDDLPF